MTFFDALSDFKALLHDFRGVSLWAVGGGLAVPFAASLADLAPPWPPGIVGVTAVVELLTLVFVYQFFQFAGKARINRALLSSAVLLIALGVAYFVLFSLFTYTTQPKKLLLVKGFICTPEAAAVYKGKCPLLGFDEVKEAEYEPERLWTQGSLAASRVVLSAVWLGSFLALSAVLGSFLVYQRRIGRRRLERPKRETAKL